MIGVRGRSHDSFDALSGAIALGEASAEERRRFDEHAVACTLCCDDAAAPVFVAAVRRARDEETWRPSVEDGIGRAIARQSTRRWNVAIAVLSYATALSVAIDLGMTSGLGSRMLGFLEKPAAPSIAVVRHVLPVAHRVYHPVLAPAVPSPHRLVANAPKPHRAATILLGRRAPVVVPAAAASDGLIDEHVLDGLPLDPSGEPDAPHVAAVPRAPRL